MNPDISKLKPYPFQKLNKILGTVTPSTNFTPIDLSIGEPKKAPPKFIEAELAQKSEAIRGYPTTRGTPELRKAIESWLNRRFKLTELNHLTHILPVNGTREALFAIAQVIVDKTAKTPTVAVPNPFYQIYEGAAILAGAKPVFLNISESNGFRYDFNQLSEKQWANTQLLYVCSPNNPTGHITSLDEWDSIFTHADKFNFTVASDECYSEIYPNEKTPPIGSLQAAEMLGRQNYKNLVAFSSLSKRSNVPGLRSGFVAGDPGIIESFLSYRTYHGSAMGPVAQLSSIVAWNDEKHVFQNREHYRDNFSTVLRILSSVSDCSLPEAGFYLWLKTPIDAEDFALQLYKDYNVTVLPGSYLARTTEGVNPADRRVRVALVASKSECTEAADRIKKLITRLK